MADVRCPMCGKPNPESAETCQFCQARLKPLNISPFGPADDDVPDWLRGLSLPDIPGEEEAESSLSGAGSAEDADIPDWLTRLGGQDREQPKEEAAEAAAPSQEFSFGGEVPGGDQAAAPAEETPDWLSGLTGDSAGQAFSFDLPEEPAAGEAAGGAASFEEAAEPAGETSDWLSGFTGGEAGRAFSFDAPEDAAPAGAPEEAAEPAGETPDWLSSLGGSQGSSFSFEEPQDAAPAGAPEQAAEPAGETSDWLSGFTGGEAGRAFSFDALEDAAPEGAPEEAAEPAGETPDWLSSLGGSQGSSFSFDEPQEAAGGAASFEEAAEPAGETPDWLSSLGGSQGSSFSFDTPQEAAGGAAPSEEAAEPAGETPDWLSSLGSGHEQPFTFDEIEEPAAEPASETPDWLSGLPGASQAASFEAAGSEEAAPEGAAEPAGDLPDWLSSLTGASQPSEAPFSAPAGESGDWFSQQLSGAEWLPKETAEPGSEQAPAEEGQVPDWLSDAAGAAGAFAVGADRVEAAASGEQEAGPAEALPEWLSKLDKASQPAGSGVPAFTMDEGEEAFSMEETQAGKEPGLAGGMPDWISQVSAESVQEPAPGEAEPEPSLAQADLPDWLEAMRPVEAGAGMPGEAFRDTTDDRLENAGPLAGLRGVLPAETGSMRVHKPSAYTLKVPVPDDQQQRMSLLQELLAGEAQAQALPTKAALSSQLILRLLVFAALVVISVVALWLGPQTPLPTAENAALEVQEAEQLVAGLPAGAPVLVALDYEPGFSDEMESLVGPFINHLAGKNAYLAFASTSPAGPILAANLMDRSGYTQFANLGFIPGGANGLLAFASAPAQTLPLELGGSPAWVGTPLAADQGLASFKLAVLATDDTDVARAWIEQTAPLLEANNVPLVVLTSAQAGPMVQPYFATSPRVVDGLVSGLAGGAAYQSLSGTSGTAGQTWDAFVLATNAVVVFIVLGGLFSLVMGYLPQRKPAKGEGKA